MKYLFHLLLILLLAFIIAGGYEVYVVRDGQVKRNDMYEETVQKLGGREALLSGDVDKKTFAGVFGSSSTGAVLPDVEEDEYALLDVYRTGTLDENELQGTSTARYHILEYCTPGVSYCKQAYKQNVAETLASQFASSNYAMQAYVANFGGVDERVWAGMSCTPEEKKGAYLHEVYTTKKLTLDTLLVLGKKLKIQNFETCVEESNVRLQLRTSMKQAKDLFAISALPTYVIVDTEEGRWVSIPGLYDEKSLKDLVAQEFPVRK